MYMYIKSMYNTIFLCSFILDTSDDDDGTGSGVDCKLLWVIRVCNYGLLKNGVFSQNAIPGTPGYVHEYSRKYASRDSNDE